MRASGRLVWAGFGGFCLLAGSRWLVAAALPAVLPPGPRSALHAGLLTLVLGLAGWRRGLWEGWGRVGGLGALVFALPGALVAGASGHLAGMTEELVFLLLPVVVVFTVAQTAEFGQGDDMRRLFGPALAGLAGAALMVPFTLPASVAGQAWMTGLVLSVAAAGWATVRLHAVLQGKGVLWASATIAGASAMVAAFAPGWGEVSRAGAADWALEAGEALLLDGPLLVLGVWCLREMAPIRFSARVLVVLLIAIVETFIAARPPVTWTIGAGVGLMAGGAAWLLRQGGPESDEAGARL